MNTEQYQAVTTPHSVAIRAGAGTGKTRVIVERYVDQLKKGLSPLQILVVTYTEKAAVELRARIRKRVNEEFGEQPDVLAELEAAPISTMHALCARICRDHPTLAQVPVGFTLLDDLNGSLQMQRWMDQALNGLPPEIFERVTYSRLRRILRGFHDDPFTALQALDRASLDWFELIEQARDSAWEELLASQGWKEASQQLGAQEGKVGDKLELVRQSAQEALTDLEAGDHKSALAKLLDIKINVGSKANWRDITTVKAALRFLRDTVKAEPLLALQYNSADKELRETLPHLARAFEITRTEITRRKQRTGVLDYADLEIHALEALTNLQVVKYYRERWLFIMVDEFQDTSPVQAKILERLSSHALLTIVGDDQQAIYGFRGAGQKVFDQFQSLIESRNGITVTLKTSYRTQAALLSSLNMASIAVLGEQTRPLSPSRTGAASNFTALLYELDGPSEAEKVAEYIAELLHSAPMVEDPTTGQERPLCAGDVAVLARKWSVLDEYANALARHNVPALIGGGGDLLRTPEARDISVLLRFLADQSDELALLSLLRSPYFAVDDPTIDELQRVKGRDESWWHLCQRSNTPTVKRAVIALKELISHSAIMPPRQLLQLADRLTGYRAVLFCLSDAPRRLSDYQACHELVEHLQGSLRDCVSTSFALQSLLATERPVPRFPLSSASVVTLSTIHGAKGLEWPVVAVVGIDGRSYHRFKEVRFDAELGTAIRENDREGELQEPALYTLIKRREQLREEAEERRLIYVGMTRVRDYLLLSTSNAKSRVVMDLKESGITSPHLAQESVQVT